MTINIPIKLPFDSIYILTCRSTATRLSHVEQQLKTLGLNGRIPISTLYSPSSELFKHFISQLPMSDWNRRHPYGFWCTMGHYLIAHNALDRGFRRPLILEDDIRLLNDAPRFFDALARLPNDADWTLLDWWPFFYSDYWRSGAFIQHMQQHASDVWVPWSDDPAFKVKSAGAYIASEKGLKAIISVQDAYVPGSPDAEAVGSYRTADEIFDTALAKHFQLACYLANPILARQVDLSGHGGGKDRLYLKGQMVSPAFNLDHYTWPF